MSDSATPLIRVLEAVRTLDEITQAAICGSFNCLDWPEKLKAVKPDGWDTMTSAEKLEFFTPVLDEIKQRIGWKGCFTRTLTRKEQ